MVFISGAAGTSKTFLAVLAGLMLLNKHSVSDIIYVRTIIESASKSLGSLPGEKELKMEPFVCPLLDKLDELLPANEIKALMNDGRIEGMPINYLRGSSYNAKYILLDEGQNASYEEIVTTITRLGKFSKMIIAGDPGQADIGVKSGFQRMYQLFDDEKCRENGIYCFSFGPEDIVRSGTLRFIIERLEYDRKLKLGLIDIDGTPRAEPMFPPV